MTRVKGPDTPVRVGVFSDVAEAELAVSRLLSAGFTKEQITVICSDETRQRHFRQFEHQHPAGEHTPAAATGGSAIGAVLAGATAVAATLVTGGGALIFTGPIAAWAG